jgi:hypothetical protein
MMLSSLQEKKILPPISFEGASDYMIHLLCWASDE